MDVIDYLKSLHGQEAEHECKRHLSEAIDQLHYAAIAAESAGYGNQWRDGLRLAIECAQTALDELR